MRFWSCGSLSLVLASVIIAAGADTDNGLTQSQKDNVLAEHNEFRRTYATPPAKNMIELRWDPLLAKTAYNYLTSHGCSPSFNHNADRTDDYHNLGGTNDQDGGVGENWYSAKPDAATDTALDTADGKYFSFGGAARAWVKDNCFGVTFGADGVVCTDVECSESDYFYKRQKADGSATCNPPNGWHDVGHFTQLMWAKTAWVGCGWTEACGTLCNYAPSGNVYTTSPDDLLVQENIWHAGADATCPDGTTLQNGLCQFGCTQAGCNALFRETCTVDNQCGACMDGFTAPSDPDDPSKACQGSQTCSEGGCNLLNRETCTVDDQCGVCKDGFTAPSDPDDPSQACDEATPSPTPSPTPTPKTKPSVVVKSNIANPVERGQSVTFTITVTGSPSKKPTGLIKVYDGTTLLTPAGVALTTNGVATYSTSALSQGTHSINAKYPGDGSYLASNSANLAVQVVSTPFFETLTNAALTKGTLGKAPLLSTVTHNYNGGTATKSSTTKFIGLPYKFPFPKAVTSITTKAEKSISITISPARTTVIYIYASNWPAGNYTFNKVGFTIVSKTGTSVLNGKTLNVPLTFSGIISVPALTGSFKITGPPRKASAKSKAMIWALALPFGGPH